MTRILVVDDERTLTDGLAAFLSRPSIEVETSGSLDDAKRRLEERTYDLVLSDLRMTDPDGREGLELLRLTRGGEGTRFVLMTAFGSPEIRSEALAGGAAAFFAKPLDLDALDRLVGEIASATLEPAAAHAKIRGKAEGRGVRLSDAEASRLLAAYVGTRDEEAFERLVHAFAPLVHSVPLKWYQLTVDEAEDVFQDVMLQLVAKAPEIRNVRLWMIGTAVNCSRQQIGRRARHRRTAEGWGAELGRRLSVHVDAEADIRELTWRAVASLSDRDRRLMQAIYHEGLSYAEISARFGMPEGSIGPTRGRILKNLARKVSCPNRVTPRAGATAH